MERQMFCFQCEQTAGGSGCKGKAGVCGKPAEVARLQDVLTGALIALVRRAKGDEKAADSVAQLVIKGLFTTITNVNFTAASIRELIDTVHAEKVHGVAGASAADYDMNLVWNANEDIRSLKSLILFGLRGMAAYAYHAHVLGYADPECNRFLVRGLSAVGEDGDGQAAARSP